MRKSHKKPQKATQNPELEGLEAWPEKAQRKPWETSAEYDKFLTYLLMPKPRSIRGAYRLYCEQNGREPAENVPGSWYKLANGEYRAFRKAKRQLAAIERAEAIHARSPHWEELEYLASQCGDLDQYEGEVGEIMNGLMLIDYAFHSLAIDLNGDPLPGWKTWYERRDAFWEAVAKGEEPAPAGYDGPLPKKT